MEEGAHHGASMADDLQKELVVVEVCRREAEASLQEMGKKAGCCLGVDEEVLKILVLAQLKSLQVEEGEVRVSLKEHREV